MGIEKLNLDGLSTPDNVGQNEVVQGNSTDSNSIQNRISPGAINPPKLPTNKPVSVRGEQAPVSEKTLGSDSSEKKQIRPEVRKSRIIGELSVFFHKDDYDRLKKRLEKTCDMCKEGMFEHIESEQKRLEKKLKKLFVLEEKLTGQKSEALLEALKNLPDKGSDEVPIFGGKKDVDQISSDRETMEDRRKKALYRPSKEEHEAVSYSIDRIKKTYEYGVTRAKNLSYSIMSLLSRYAQLTLVKENLEDERYEKAKSFMDNAVGSDKKIWTNIGPVEDNQPV